MAEQTRNVSTYEIDASKAEESVKRLNALLVQLRETQEKGGDTSAIQAAIAAESAGLDNLTSGQKKAADASGDLFKRKRDLVDILSAVNPALGQASRQLLEVGDALTGVSGAGLKWNLIVGASAAAIGGLVLLYQQWAAAARDAAKAQDEASQAAARGRNAAGDARVAMEQRLAQFGVGPDAAPGAEAAAATLRTQFGATREQGEALGAMGAAGGLAADDLVLLLGLTRQGNAPSDPAAARQALDALRASGADVQIRQQVEGFRGSEAARRAAMEATADRGPRAGASEALFEQLKQSGKLPESVTLQAFQDSLIIDTLKRQLEEMMQSVSKDEPITLRELLLESLSSIGLPTASRIGIESGGRAGLRARIAAAGRVPAGMADDAMEAGDAIGGDEAGAGTHNTPGY